MDSLQDISSMCFIVVGVLVGLVPLLHLQEKCIQSSWGYFVFTKQIMSLKQLMSNVSQRLVDGQMLCLKDCEIPTVQGLIVYMRHNYTVITYIHDILCDSLS
jgi:hypothetical protein